MRKQAFADQKAARAAAAALRARKQFSGVGAYKCKTCRQWHVGRRNGRRGRP